MHVYTLLLIYLNRELQEKAEKNKLKLNKKIFGEYTNTARGTNIVEEYRDMLKDQVLRGEKLIGTCEQHEQTQDDVDQEMEV